MVPSAQEWVTETAKGTLLSWWAERQPDTAAVVAPSGSRTFAQLDRRANQLVRVLRSRGLAEGDAIALLSTNRVEYAEVFAATLRGGFRLTPINSHLTADEVAYIAGDCEASAFIADAELGDVARSVDVPAARVRLALGGAIEGFESYDDALASASPDALDDPVLGGLMMYTSGTTGRPKGVFRAKPTPLAYAAVAAYGYQAGDVHLCTGPLYHLAPLSISLHMPLHGGATVVVMDRWDTATALELVERHGVTHTHMVPTMFHRLLALPQEVKASRDTSSLRVVVHGAAPCPVPVKKALIEWLGPVVFEYYAATEGTGTVVDSLTWLQRPGTVGKPLPEGWVIVGDDDANPLPVGEVGLVWLTSPETDRFRYHGDDAKTAKTFRGDRFTLGDMGYLDADGFLFLTDRDANLIISGGVNIYPAETDAVLLEHPAVADAATIGVPDDEWGESVLAVVELREGVDGSVELADELRAFCRERLAPFKCPRAVDFVDHLPREDNGKIYKRRIRDAYRERAASGS
ncbi:MAG: long-chain acyl-CoA synthetase [Acidimicrobiaceae bacterium]